MSDFRIKFEWEDSPKGVRALELAATWARLEISCGSSTLTKVEAVRSNSIREGIYVPLFPLAEWAVTNWWSLWNRWNNPHSLLEAREGFSLPDLRIESTETQTRLAWRPLNTPAVSFLGQGRVDIRKSAVEGEFRRLVDATLERLRAKGIAAVHLADVWSAIHEAEIDPETRAFCERLARMGCDPHDSDETVAEEVERLTRVLPASVVDELCDAVPASRLVLDAALVEAVVEQTKGATRSSSDWVRVRREFDTQMPAVTPWRSGYELASRLRQTLDLDGVIGEELDSKLNHALGTLDTRPVALPSNIQAVAAGSRSEGPIFGLRSSLGREAERFARYRAIGDFLTASEPTLITKGQSEHQQRNRAFAAEILAPAGRLRSSVRGEVDGEQIEDLAREFQVSPFVIQHQIDNHRLARTSPTMY
jgi:hypothetical protein